MTSVFAAASVLARPFPILTGDPSGFVCNAMACLSASIWAFVRRTFVAVPAFLPLGLGTIALSTASVGATASLLAAGNVAAASGSIASQNVGAAARRGLPLSVTGTGVESGSSFKAMSEINAPDLTLVAARPLFRFGCDRRQCSL